MFDTIADSEKGGIYDQVSDFRAMAQASGSRKDKTARINLNLMPGSKRKEKYPNGEWALAWGVTIIHELMHHAAGKGGFTDEQLAKAVASVKGINVPDFKGTDDELAYKFSAWWSRFLENACK